MGTAGCIMSCSNADAVRLKAKQHPCPVLLGPMGIGKSSCQDLCMWHLCGTREVAKIDSGRKGNIEIGENLEITFVDTRNTTVKRLAALKTFPTCIEVNIYRGKKLPDLNKGEFPHFEKTKTFLVSQLENSC